MVDKPSEMLLAKHIVVFRKQDEVVPDFINVGRRRRGHCGNGCQIQETKHVGVQLVRLGFTPLILGNHSVDERLELVGQHLGERDFWMGSDPSVATLLATAVFSTAIGVARFAVIAVLG